MILRKKVNNDYFIASREILKNKSVSLKAKGLLMQMLSLPDNWSFSLNGIVALSSDGVDSTRAAINELKQLGYLKINKKQDNVINYEWIVYETPYSDFPHTEPYSGFPYTENPLLLNNNILISNNNKEIYKEIPTEKEEDGFTKRVIDYLNKKSGFKYSYKSSNTIRLIKARFNEGYKEEDFYKVIDNKCRDWLGNDFKQYLRPQTLFSGKFDVYLNQNTPYKKSTGKSETKQPEWYNDYLKNRYTTGEKKEPTKDEISQFESYFNVKEERESK